MSEIMGTYMNYSCKFSVQKIFFILFEPHESCAVSYCHCFVMTQ